MDNLKSCKICNKSFVNPQHGMYGLTSHIKNNHSKISLEEYFLKYIGNSCKCLSCGKDVSFRGLFKGYAKFCSISCSNEHSFKTDKNRRKNLIKWGKFNGKNQKERLSERNKTIESRKISSETSTRNWENLELRKRMSSNKEKGIENCIRFNSNPVNFLHNKGVWGKVSEYKNSGIIMRSNLERSFAELLDVFNIKWEYEPKTFKFKNGTQLQYTPDFLVNGNIFVEIKMKKHQTSKVKKVIEDVLNQHKIKVVILDKKDFFKFCSKIK